MYSYRCDNCGAQWTVYMLCLDCPFCHVGHYYRAQQNRQYERRLYEQRLTNAPASGATKP